MNIIIQKLTSPMATSFSWYFSINGNASSKSFKKEIYIIYELTFVNVTYVT